MKKNKIVWLAGALALLFWSCQPGPSPLSRMIPGDAVAVAYLENPGATLKDASWLGDNLGLTSLTEGKSLETWAVDLVKKTDGTLEASWFDLTRPAAIALGGDGAFTAALPISGDAKALPGVQAYFDSQGLQAEPLDGWIVLSSVELKLPLAEGFDFKKITQGKAAGNATALRYWVDIRKAFKLAGVEPSALEGLFSDFGGEMSGAGMSADSIRSLAAGISQGMGELETFSGALQVGSQGVEFLSDLRFTPDGWIHGLLSRQKPAQGTRDFLKYLPQDYLLGMVTNLDQSVWKKELRQVSELLGQPLQTVGVQDALLDLQGNRSAFSLDLDVNSQALMSGNWGEGLRIYAVGAQEVKDAGRWKKTVLDYLRNSQDLLRQLSDQFKTLGMPLSLDFQVEEGLKEEGLTYDRINLVLSTPGEDAGSGMDIVLPLLSQLDLQINLASRQDKVFMTLGKKGLGSLKALVETDAYPGKTWATGLDGLAAAYPAEAHMAGNFNISRLLQVIRKVPEAAMVPAGVSGSPGLTGFTQLESGGIITGMAWNYREMEAVIKPFSAFLPLVMQNFGD